MNIDPKKDAGRVQRGCFEGREEICHELALTHSHLENLTASELLEKIVSGMDSQENWSPYWRDAAIPFLCGLLKTVYYHRDQGRIALTHKTLLKFMTFEEVFSLSEDRNIPQEFTSGLKQYLQSLPGFARDEAIMGSAHIRCYEHHGHLAMQVARALNN